MERNLGFIVSQYMNSRGESQPLFRTYEYRGWLDVDEFGLIVYDLQQMTTIKET